MSAIASFYLLPREKSQELVAAAQAQAAALSKKKWGIFKPKLPLTPDPFWDFLSTQARELAEFPYSGYLLLDVDLIVEGALLGDDTDELASLHSSGPPQAASAEFKRYAYHPFRENLACPHIQNSSTALPCLWSHTLR
jgi:hypothetical protein